MAITNIYTAHRLDGRCRPTPQQIQLSHKADTVMLGVNDRIGRSGY
jgi:hypothetical protein